MRIEFSGKITETKKCQGVWLNSITVRLKDGTEVVLDRDTTEYSIDGNELSMLWRGVYEWDGENANYDIEPKKFDGCELADVFIEEDADEAYNIEIEEMEIC